MGSSSPSFFVAPGRRPCRLWQPLLPLLHREWLVVKQSRIAWTYTTICLAWATTAAITGSETVTWTILPLLMNAMPAAGLLLGVAAIHGDDPEEPLLVARVASDTLQIFGKWLVWTSILLLATVALLIPLLAGGESFRSFLSVAGYATGEAAVFVAIGLFLGKLCRDSVLAHSLALVSALLAIAGGGVLAWLAARQPFFQDNPNAWTLLLMLHPVEALRVSLMFSLDPLPIDARNLGPLARWWLSHASLWYLVMSLAESFAALAACRMIPRTGCLAR